MEMITLVCLGVGMKFGVGRLGSAMRMSSLSHAIHVHMVVHLHVWSQVIMVLFGGCPLVL